MEPPPPAPAPLTAAWANGCGSCVFGCAALAAARENADGRGADDEEVDGLAEGVWRGVCGGLFITNPPDFYDSFDTACFARITTDKILHVTATKG